MPFSILISFICNAKYLEIEFDDVERLLMNQGNASFVNSKICYKENHIGILEMK